MPGRGCGNPRERLDLPGGLPRGDPPPSRIAARWVALPLGLCTGADLDLPALVLFCLFAPSAHFVMARLSSCHILLQREEVDESCPSPVRPHSRRAVCALDVCGLHLGGRRRIDAALR